MAFLMCTTTLVADAFQVRPAAGVPRPQHHIANGNDPLAHSMCLIYLRSMCIQQKNHNPPLAQSVTNTGVYLDFLCSGILMLCLVICGNRMPTRCNRGIYCISYCLLNMFRAPLCPSSGAQGLLYSGCCPWNFVLWFSSCWPGVELRVMCPVCRMLQHRR